MLGLLSPPESTPPLDDVIEQALRSSELLESECLSERARGEVGRYESEEQFLAGATIDFMLATELAILDAPSQRRDSDALILPQDVRRGLWRSAVALADAAFEIRGGGGPGTGLVSPILPRPTPPAPIAPSKDKPLRVDPRPLPRPLEVDRFKPRREPPTITNLGGGSVQSEDGTIWKCCDKTTAELFAKATGPTTSAVTAIVGPVASSADAVLALLPQLPSDVTDFVERATEHARRALARALKAVLRFLRKLAASAGGGVAPALGTAFSEVVSLAKPKLATVAMKRLTAFDDYQHGIDQRVAGDSDGGRIPIADLRFRRELDALDGDFKGSLKWFNHITHFGATFTHLAAAAGGPILPVSVMSSIVAYVVFLLRRCLETMPASVLRRNGIPSLVTSALARPAVVGR